MYVLIVLENLGMSFGERWLFKNVNLQINQGDRIGLVGKNGTGKTTLLKLIAGELEPTEGQIHRSSNIEIHRQEQIHDSDMLAGELLKITSDSQELPQKERLRRSLLNSLGFKEADLKKHLRSFSGGEVTRLALVKAVLEQPDVLLLDEPTNHMDLKGINYLRNLVKYQKTLVAVSHDRSFLREVCNKIWEINAERIWAFSGNFDSYLKQRSRIVKEQQRNMSQWSKEAERLQKIIDMYMKRGTEKAIKQAKSKQKMLNTVKTRIQNLHTINEESTEKLRFPPPSRSGYVNLNVEHLCFSELLKDVNFKIHRGEKVALVGENGVGKTTLLRILSGNIKPSKGSFFWGHNVRYSLISQTTDFHDPKKSIIETLWQKVPAWPDYEVRKWAGRFGFPGDEVFKSITDLSGGERKMLALACTLLENSNFLLLDEPTNHLDLNRIQALEKALKDFNGTILMVSHDRELIESVCSRILLMRQGKVFDIESLSEYLNLQESHTPRESTSQRNQFERRRKLSNELKKLREHLAQCEAIEKKLTREIERINKEKHENAYNYVKLTELTQLQQELEDKVIETLEHMEATEKRIAQLEAMF